MSTSSDTSSEDECSIYVNAALKLNALSNQTKKYNGNTDDRKDDDSDAEEFQESGILTTDNNELVQILTEDSYVAEEQDVVQVVEDNSGADPVICIDDDEFQYVCNRTPQRRTRNSRKRNTTVINKNPLGNLQPGELQHSVNPNDSIEEELNKSCDDSFSLSQDDDNCVLIGSPESNRSNTDHSEVTIKVLWKSDQLQRFKLGKYETFQKIFKCLANLEGISEDQILITKKDKRITLFDTPASIGWSILDILDGGVVSAALVKKHKGNPAQDDISKNSCKIKVQTSDKKTLLVTLKNDEPFSTILKTCAAQLNVPESKIKFYFDGEFIELNETPKTLDLEDEACIDCKISK